MTRKIPSSWTTWYETTYYKNGEKFSYTTKSHTQIHNVIHVEAAKRGEWAQTLMYDKTVEWPFGLYAEVIQTTKDEKAKSHC